MSNKYLGKIKFLDNKNIKNDVYKNEDILNFELMNLTFGNITQWAELIKEKKINRHL